MAEKQLLLVFGVIPGAGAVSAFIAQRVCMPVEQR
jgi:hypothetical protein